ncbi:hypothetical protein MT418_004205 [Batrachochytrium dendrobatidis]
MQSLYAALGSEPAGSTNNSTDDSSKVVGSTTQSAQWGVSNMIIPIKRKPIQGFKPRSATTVIKKQSVFGSAEIVTDPATAPPVVSAVAPVVNIRPVVTHPTAKPSVTSASQQSSARSSVIRKIDTSALVHGAAPGAIGDYDPTKPCQFWVCRKEAKRIKQKAREKLLAKAMEDMKKNAPQIGSFSANMARSFVQPASKQNAQTRSDPAPVSQPAAVHPDVSGEDAYLRRLRMSETQQSFREQPPSTIKTPVQASLPTPHYAQSSGQRTINSNPTQVVVLTNLVGKSEVDDELRRETTEECAKFGKVIECSVYEVPGSHVPDDEAVRVFVEFADLNAAIKAQADMHGRFFGGRKVTAGFWPISKWQLQNFDY